MPAKTIDMAKYVLLQTRLLRKARRGGICLPMFGLICCMALAMAPLLWLTQAHRYAPQRFQSEIDSLLTKEASNNSLKNGVVFVGSSSIRLWKLPNLIAGLPTLNRGFGGSHLADTLHYLRPLVLRHEPRAVVIYAGDNDIANGVTPVEIADAFRRLVKRIHSSYPQSVILYISIKPSLKRWEMREKQREANNLVAAHCAVDARIAFLDISEPMLGADGKPRPELFVDDGLHLSEAGYAIWLGLVSDRLEQLLAHGGN